MADIDDFYTSRLRGDPAEGIDGVHTHPAIPRTARLNRQLSFGSPAQGEAGLSTRGHDVERQTRGHDNASS